MHREALRVALGFSSGTPPQTSCWFPTRCSPCCGERPHECRLSSSWMTCPGSTGPRRRAELCREKAGRERAGLLVTLPGRRGKATSTGQACWNMSSSPWPTRLAAQLVLPRFPDLDPWVMTRVLSTAQGNPLALLELPEALSPRAAIRDGGASVGAAARPAPARAVHVEDRAATAGDQDASPHGGPGRRRGRLRDGSGRRR